MKTSIIKTHFSISSSSKSNVLFSRRPGLGTSPTISASKWLDLIQENIHILKQTFLGMRKSFDFVRTNRISEEKLLLIYISALVHELLIAFIFYSSRILRSAGLLVRPYKSEGFGSRMKIKSLKSVLGAPLLLNLMYSEAFWTISRSICLNCRLP